MNWLFYIGAAVLAGFAIRYTLIDFDCSLHMPLYTRGEDNDLVEGKDGYFSLPKGIAFAGFWLAACVITPFFLPENGTAAVLLLPLIWFIKNVTAVPGIRKRHDAAKGFQFTLLEDGTFDDSELEDFKGSVVLRPFFDIRVPPGIGAYDQLLEKLHRLRGKPNTEWWKRDRAKSL